MLATQFHGEWGDAYVAFESVMREHARDGGWRRSGAVNETETFEGDEERTRRERRAIREMWNQRNRKGGEIKARPQGLGGG